jgi:pimeloyl-ACP methyl ester carboxylesterase
MTTRPRRSSSWRTGSPEPAVTALGLSRSASPPLASRHSSSIIAASATAAVSRTSSVHAASSTTGARRPARRRPVARGGADQRPGGEAGWRHVVAIGEDSRWRNRVSARWLLGRPYRPARHAAKLHCPWLVCVGESDRVARPGSAIAAARRAPFGELRTYPGVDHFDIYDGPEHEAVVADEIEFLQRYLLEQPA